MSAVHTSVAEMFLLPLAVREPLLSNAMLYHETSWRTPLAISMLGFLEDKVHSEDLVTNNNSYYIHTYRCSCPSVLYSNKPVGGLEHIEGCLGTDSKHARIQVMITILT